MVFAQERKINICVGQVIDNEVFLSCDGAAEYPLSAGSTAEIRLSDQIVQLVTFSRADQFQAIDQKAAQPEIITRGGKEYGPKQSS